MTINQEKEEALLVKLLVIASICCSYLQTKLTFACNLDGFFANCLTWQFSSHQKTNG